MKRLLPLLLGGGLAWAVGCEAHPSLPQYMQDLPKSEQETHRVIDEIQRELGRNFRIERVETFFFVASDDTASSFKLCKTTLARIYGFLYQDFFSKKPEKPIRVYLFKDKDGYENYCKATYKKVSSTPFGFYMASERKMVMNISTGRGTLAHELVHPLLAEDFPDVPSWFNEGFASLYEQSGERNGKMIGFVNWRLQGLQKAIRAEKGAPLRDLLKTDAAQFYGDDRGINYATARYLCLWLQEQDRLASFYKEFKTGFRDDPTGAMALEKVAGGKLEDLEKRWQEWALALEP